MLGDSKDRAAGGRDTQAATNSILTSMSMSSLAVAPRPHGAARCLIPDGARYNTTIRHETMENA